MITSEANVQIKELLRLQKSARERRKKNCFIVEGMKLVKEAFLSGSLKKVYLSETALRQEMDLTEYFSGNVDCETVADPVFHSISDTVTPQGILGTAQKPEYALEALLEDRKKRFLLLDNLRDPGNLGTIMRTAEGAGMSAVFLSKESVDLFNPKVVRSTMGSIFRVPFSYVDDLPEIVERLKKRKISVYGCMMEGSSRFDLCDYKGGAGIVIGNEANGISENVIAHLSGSVRIPMAGKLESLNAAVAAAVLMYELAREDFGGMEEGISDFR